eukprot:3857247-Rhodomonas_salina.2
MLISRSVFLRGSEVDSRSIRGQFEVNSRSIRGHFEVNSRSIRGQKMRRQHRASQASKGRHCDGAVGLHPEIQYKKPHFQYILYQECGFLSLILGCTRIAERVGIWCSRLGVYGARA